MFRPTMLSLIVLFLVRELSMYTVIRPIYMRRRLDPGAKLPGKIKTVFQISGSLLIILLLLASQLGLLSISLVRSISFYILCLLIASSLISLYWYIAPIFKKPSPSGKI